MMKRAITLVEVLIVMAIIAIMAIILIGILKPTAIMNKAIDAQTKKDLGRMKVAFEEYFNDNGCYPNQTKLAELMEKSNCYSSTIFIPWINKWPCDHEGNPFVIQIGNDINCPKWFKILTKLNNELDVDIPKTWYVGDPLGSGEKIAVNYGVTSTNIGLVDEIIDSDCTRAGSCFYEDSQGHCQSLGANESCSSPNCFLGYCRDECRVSHCGDE
ncbi:prepilin-type N-terminal cleavage/methylation domain-containing protein [Candidatus Shapirobacteria bacterium]|nr:prepilin-type N-terminal cleavage/methylation domain-containing protein [Candidatus Shapirobacteria bacterium]